MIQERKETAARRVAISTGASRMETTWKAKELTWDKLADSLGQTGRTRETAAEYKAMSRTERGRAKDVGGFVGGVLLDGRRKKGAVKWRTLVTLDADHGNADLWAMIETLTDWACVVYSTHSHTDAAPRFRVVIPLSEPVPAEQYEPIARMIASDLGMDLFDDTTYEAHRLMYWPSTSADGPFVYHKRDGEWADPEALLARYEAKGMDWRDPLQWPRSGREAATRRREVEKAGDPLSKPGLIGAFCRTYRIGEAIDTFLPDAYTEAGEGRWTFKGGSTMGGLVGYDDGLYCYSHHESDPAGGRLCNAWDLVRLHLFGKEDPQDADTPMSRTPSHRLMTELAMADEAVRRTMAETRREEAAEDFTPVEHTGEGGDPEAWIGKLDVDKYGNARQTIGNARMIMEHDSRLAGKMRYDEFANRITTAKGLPWRKKGDDGRDWKDADDAGLRLYLEQAYGLASVGKIQDAFTYICSREKYHPVRDYLNGLVWDGVERVDTILVDYLGAVDSHYVRTVTRKTLVAAVARVMEPGCKYDYMLMLTGSQGLGKSYLIQALARQWHSDSIDSVQGKDAYEALQGAWILEMAELSAMRRSDAEAVKHFISKSEDMYRVAYGRYVQRFPRQCIFIGTTNETEFLKDRTGNRRFWPVEVGKREPTADIFHDMGDEVIGQLWAEAVSRYADGETRYLDKATEAVAVEAQQSHMEQDVRIGQVAQYLDVLVADNWEAMDGEARRRFLKTVADGMAKGTVQRTRICALEIAVELFGADRGRAEQVRSRELNDIMRQVPGWIEIGHATKFGVYGPQRGFERLPAWGNEPFLS